MSRRFVLEMSEDEVRRILGYFDRISVPHRHSEEQLTKQSFKDECDINLIMSRWKTQGVQPPMNSQIGAYGDFTCAEDFQTMLERVRAAEASFAALPADIRRRCDNDPAEFLNFVSEEANRKEMQQLGIIPADPPSGTPGGDAATPRGGGEVAPPGQKTPDEGENSSVT